MLISICKLTLWKVFRPEQAVLDVLLVRAQIAAIGCVCMGCVRCVACASTDCCDRLCLHGLCLMCCLCEHRLL